MTLTIDWPGVLAALTAAYPERAAYPWRCILLGPEHARLAALAVYPGSPAALAPTVTARGGTEDTAGWLYDSARTLLPALEVTERPLTERVEVPWRPIWLYTADVELSAGLWRLPMLDVAARYAARQRRPLVVMLADLRHCNGMCQRNGVTAAYPGGQCEVALVEIDRHAADRHHTFRHELGHLVDPVPSAQCSNVRAERFADRFAEVTRSREPRTLGELDAVVDQLAGEVTEAQPEPLPAPADGSAPISPAGRALLDTIVQFAALPLTRRGSSPSARSATALDVHRSIRPSVKSARPVPSLRSTAPHPARW